MIIRRRIGYVYCVMSEYKDANIDQQMVPSESTLPLDGKQDISSEKVRTFTLCHNAPINGFPSNRPIPYLKRAKAHNHNTLI